MLQLCTRNMNVYITGRVCGQAIIDHPDVRKVGFTGSTPVGKQIMASCATSNLKKCSLELGGKSPLIVFADCDMTKAVRMVSLINCYKDIYTVAQPVCKPW